MALPIQGNVCFSVKIYIFGPYTHPMRYLRQTAADAAVLLVLFSALSLLAGTGWVQAAPADPLVFDDQPLEEPLEYPSWFKLSFLDLQEDLDEAVQADKRGMILYFGQSHCPYCKALLEVNFASPDIVAYTQQYFDVIPIDVFGGKQVTDLDGASYSESGFAKHHKTTFTPSLVFYDAKGKEALRMVGYHPPYRLRAALEYVADAHYQRESFRDYLARGEGAAVLESAPLITDPLFVEPPYIFDRTRFAAQRPLVVFFEQAECHACDVLHAGPMANAQIRTQLAHLEMAQLNMWADTPVVTPQGERLTAKQWAARMGLYYAPWCSSMSKARRSSAWPR